MYSITGNKDKSEYFYLSDDRHIYLVLSKGDISIKEQKAKLDGKLGLILLAGNQCSLGITLPLCDIVVLLNNTLHTIWVDLDGYDIYYGVKDIETNAMLNIQ